MLPMNKNYDIMYKAGYPSAGRIQELPSFPRDNSSSKLLRSYKGMTRKIYIINLCLISRGNGAELFAKLNSA